MTWQINVFGVRHLSPMGAWQLREFLDASRPDLVLIEGLDDATDLLPDVTRKQTQPPIAILAYTDTLPVRTLVYPLRGTARSTRRFAGRMITTFRSSSSICRPTSFSVCKTPKSKGWKRSGARQASRPPSKRPSALARCRRPRAAAVAVSADRRTGRRTRLRHVLGTPF